ncbi:MAG: hypothetical protein HY610_01855 [Elusimicrobia bacterium]|nr:hypothetical protein [Elusimicrobiota bacterium]
MKTQIVLLFPFDLGLELDFMGQQTQKIVHAISQQSLSPVSLQGKIFTASRAQSHLYRFGTGIIQINFHMDDDLNACADLSCNVEKISVGKTSIFAWCQSQVTELLQRAEVFAAHRYDLRLTDSEIFPIFVFSPEQVKNADHFIRQNYKSFYGMVTGEPNFDMLSDFVFKKEPLGNFGYYENEMILLKRFGAVISSSESETILDILALSYAQYWSLKSYHFVLDSELDQAQKLLQDLPPYYQFWKIPSRYQRFSRDAIDFGKDKLSIVDSLYNVSTNIPQIEMDWHLRTLYKDIAQIFNIDELYKTVEIKLNRIEESYNQAREFLSTNFFILLDIIFCIWLLWGIFDTVLLLTIARK